MKTNGVICSLLVAAATTLPTAKALPMAMAVPSGMALPTAGHAAAAPRSSPVSLAQAPLVMRLSKDEFRIAFGLSAQHCATRGCSGVIRYRVDWKADDGTTRHEIKHVNYRFVPQSSRALAVDRQYFDTAEGAHTTEVLHVRVDRIT